MSHEVENLITLEIRRFRGNVKVSKEVNGCEQVDEEPLYCNASRM